MCSAISVPDDRVSTPCSLIFLRKFSIFRQCYPQVVTTFSLSNTKNSSSGYGKLMSNPFALVICTGNCFRMISPPNPKNISRKISTV